MVVVVTAGCGGDDRAARRLAAAADQAVAAGTAYFTLTVTTLAAPLPAGAVAIEATGETDLVRHATHMTTELAAGAPSEIVIVGGAVHIRGGLVAAAVGDRWLRLTSGADDLDLGAFARGVTPDPVSILLQLRGADPSVADLGPDSIRGVDARHLRATVARERLLDELPAAERDVIAARLDRLGFPATSIVEVWLDGSGLPLRVTTSYRFDDPRLGPTEQRVQLDLSEHGAQVAIAAPPADQVVDAASLSTGAPTPSPSP